MSLLKSVYCALAVLFCAGLLNAQESRRESNASLTNEQPKSAVGDRIAESGTSPLRLKPVPTLLVNGDPSIVEKLGSADGTSAFDVNDVSNKTLFRVFGSGVVAVGTTNQEWPFEVQHQGAGSQIVATSFGTGSGHFMGRSARGTQATPLATGLDDFLANFSGRGFDGSAFTGGVARMSIRAAEPFSGTAQGAYIAFETMATQTVVLAERMRIASNGNVGIGTLNPTYKLDVSGTTHISGNVTVDGNLAAKYQDVAEWVRSDEPLEPGTVVVLDADHRNQVKRSWRVYDTAVAGVVSAAPGIILGEPSDDKAKIATTGRVKMLVDASTGAIHIGDLLVTSDKSGVAMKSQPVRVAGITMHRPGTIVGKALEPLAEGQGEILVLLSLQ